MVESVDPKYRFDTLAIHVGQEPDPVTLARAVPIHRTASYVFKDAQHASALFSLKELGNIYTRLMNPTTDVLEKRMAALESGVGALAVASGTSAIFNSLINLMEAGDELVSARNLYGGTYTMFNDILPHLGITARFVDHRDTKKFREAVNSKTRAIFLETIGNPKLGVPDFDEIARIAQDAHVPLIVDSTFTPPCIFKPIEHGADVVVHSLTKWIGGHGTGIGGVVVDAGKFDWTDSKFGLFAKPEPSYGGMRFGHDLGELQTMAFILRMRLVPLRNLGACISPDNSWMFSAGSGDAFLEDGTALLQLAGGGSVPGATPSRRLGSLSGARCRSIPRYGQALFSQGNGRRSRRLRNQRKRRRSRRVHKPATIVFSSGECWRREKSRYSSC